MGPSSAARAVTRLAIVAVVGLTSFAGLAPDALAQDVTRATRPRIGLALGGGAARGFAHIGLLKWFDEHRIPVDLVAGTSMGGLVGGGFAAGMSPSEVEALIASLRWDVMLASSAPFTDKDSRRKQDAREFQTQLAFGLRGGFTLPRGLSTGQPVEAVLGRIAMPYYGISSFDELPTPYRAVAADLRKAEVVVFDRGWLAQAMRATMALPGVFPPVISGDRLLVDGGVLDNVPADVVADMGADIVIAVDVSADLTHEARAESIIGVLGDSLNTMMRGLTRRALEKATLVIEPDLRGFFGTDFNRFDEFIRRGYAAAEARKADLLPYALSDADYRAFVDARARRRRTSLPVPTFVDVEGVAGAEADAIRSRFAAAAGRPLDESRVEREVRTLMGTERYTTVSHRFVERDGVAGLMITATPKSSGPPFLLAALDLRSDPSTGIAATARGRIIAMGLTGDNDEARIDISAGTVMTAGAEWYRPLGRTGFYVAPSGSASRRLFNVFDASMGNDARSQYREAIYRGAVDIGLTSGNRFDARVGYTGEHVDGRIESGGPLLPDVDAAQAYWTAKLTFDGQDAATVPERGVFVQVRLRRFTQTAGVTSTSTAFTGDPAGFTQADLESSWCTTAGANGRIFARAAGGTSFGSTTVLNAFTLGGAFSLGAHDEGELRGSQFALATVGYLHRAYRFAEGAAGSLYVGGWIETGGAADRTLSGAIHTNVSGGFVIETPLGPIVAAGSVSTDGRYRVYASLGRLLPGPR